MNRNFAIVLLNILVVIMVVQCVNSVANTKSNVAFVIDDTASMGSEIKQVKEKAASIFNAVHSSKSSKIGDFILVTFNDYEIFRKGKFINDMKRTPIKLLTVTSKAKEFLEELSKIKVDGGGQCPEMCLEGIDRALQESNPYSFIYVFTDASAKDYKKSKEIEDLAQQKSIRITFLLTGVCNKKNHFTPDYTVYTTIARSTGGTVFYLKKNDINQIINYIKNEIQSPQTLIGSVPITPGTTNVNVKTDTGMKNLSVAVNVGINNNVNINIQGPNGNTVPTTPLVNTPNTKVVTIPNPSGPYVATINSNGHGTATLQAATTIDFTHGFQILKPSSMGSTTTQPVPGEKSHLAIRLDVIGDKEVKLQNILILDMNDNEIQRLPAELVNEKDKLYVTAPFNPPNTSFKIAIIAVDKNTGDEYKRFGRTPIDPQSVGKATSKNPVVKIKNGPKINVKYGDSLALECMVTGYPKPTIVWEDKQSGKELSSSVYPIQIPYEYMSVLKLDNIDKIGSYKCKATTNNIDYATDSVEVETFKPHFWNIIESPADTNIEYEKDAKVYCKVDAYPPARISWFRNGKELTNSVDFDIMDDKSTLLVKKMRPNLQGSYTCKAANDDNSATLDFTLTLSGVEAPQIDKTKSSNTVTEGSKAIILCSITKGSPTPSITWEFKRHDASGFASLSYTDEVIQIDLTQLDNAGVYKCHAKNIIGEDFHQIVLTVQSVPQIDKSKPTYIAIQGSKVFISCKIMKGIPKPEINWEYKRKDTNNFVSIADTGEVIQIDSADLQNAGTYRCRAKNQVGEDSHNAELIVQYRPEIDKTKSIGTTIEGSQIDIPCRIIKGYPAPVISWVFKKKGSNNFISLSESGKKISITKAQLDDAGVYKCYAKNLVGDDVHEFEFNVNCAPEIDKSKPTTIAKRGDSAIISCRITKGIPDPAISWEFKRDGDSVFVGLAGTGREVHISWADLAHAGVYRCKAKNAVAEDSFDSELIVQCPPVIDKIESSKTAVNGAKTVIPCRILKGNPTPHIAWEFRRKSATAFIALPETAEQIEVDPVDLDSAGVYRCTASNVIGQDVHETQLTVQNAPIVDVKQPKAMKIGETVTLSCDVTGEPTPVVMWMKDGVVITANQKYSIFQDHSLRFVAATVNDMGNYTCEAENLHGKSSKNATVDIYGPIKMVPPANTILNQNVGTDVELECQATGTPAPSITWQFFDVNGISKILSTKDPVLKINKIQAESAGYYICVAENGFDTGTIGFEILINFPVEIERPNQTEFNIIENDRVLRIPCKAKGFPEPLGTTWTMNSQPLVMGSFYETDSDGTLIIKNPDMSAAGKYMCIADNGIGRAYQPFTVNVSPHPVPSGPMETVLVEEKTSREIECKVPHTATDTIRWYTNGNQIPVTKLIIRNAKDSDSGVYSCRVSTLQGSQTAHMKVLVGSKPTFSYKRDNEIVIPYIHGRKSILDCYVKGNPPPTVTWWQGNIKLGANAMTYGFLMDDSHLGRKTCEATNEFGTITRTYVIKIIGCSINYKEIGLNKYHPILVESRGKLAAYENQDGVMTIPESEVIDFVCPNGVRKGYCFNNEFIITDNTAASQHVQYSDLKCDAELQPTATTITLKNYPCSADKESRLYRVGYHTGSAFCAVYDVCLNPRTGKQIFIKHDVTRYASGVIIERKPFDNTLVPIDYDVMFECAKQSYIAGPGCCFEGRQLVSPLDVSPMVQISTYFNLIVAPEWNFCRNYRNLDEIEKRIRDLAKASQYYDLEVFSGEFEDQNLYQLQDGYGNVKIAPKYLWKVVQIRQKSKGLAIVTINVPNLRDADVGKLVLCQDVCDVTDWMQGSQWRDVSAGYTFCCRPLELVAAKNSFFHSFQNLFQPNVLLKP